MPFRPKDGEVYTYRPNDKKLIKDWLADSHRFSHEGSKTLKGRSHHYKKYYYYLLVRTEGKNRITDKGFRKEVYFCKEPELEGTVVIHYRGDSSLSVPTSHGNSKIQTRIFVRTKPSVMTEIEEKVKSNTEKSSHKQYKEIISENRDGSEYVSKPRNTRQVHYQREKVKNSTRPSRCALVNLHMLEYEDTGFVHCIRTMPDLLVICGLEEIVSELEFVLENVPKFDQLLSYDTTFSMGDFYVSPLLFKHCCFIQKPIIPALFLIHERKLQDHHQAVFKVLRERMKGKLNQVPIAIDMEQGIKGAIETETTLYIVGCWRHLKKDIEAWSLKHQVVKQESKRLVDDIFSILRTKNNVQPLLESKRENWPPEFNQYFKKHLESRLPNYCLQYIQKHVNADDFNGITTNQSEGFNWLIKDLNNWKEGPIDCILLSFRFLQQYFLSEIRRGRAAIGNFTLTSAMAQRTIDMDSLDMQPPVCDFKEIVNLIRNKGFPEDAETAKTEPNLSFRAKAKEIVMANRIAFCPSFGSFVVIGATGQSFVAKLYPKETCTCAVKNAKCCHVLAVKLALRMTVEDDDSYGQDSDITKPRKFIRGKKKPGRKQPRPGDVDEPAIEIPEKKCCTEDEIGGPSLSSEENTMRQSIDAVNDAIWLFSVDGISLNLSQEEKRRIEGSFDNGWLGDTIIDATQAVLRQQFPYDEGMQSVLYAAKPEFQPVSGRFVQIINTHPNDRGLHWICFSNFNSDDGIVNLYDSSGEIFMSTATERAVAKIMCTPLPKIFVRHMKCSKQTNGNDCGVYAIANMVSILHGVDPSSISFNVAAMRRHLLQGLENKKSLFSPIENCLL